MSNIVQLNDYRPEPTIPDEMAWDLLAWNKLLTPCQEDAFLGVPYDGWPEGFSADQTPIQRELLKKITELVRPWLDAQTATASICFNGAEGVVVMVGDYDILLD